MLTYEFVKQQFENVGYKLISTEYVKAIAKLEYICDKGHVGQLSYNKLSQGRRCYRCSNQYKPTFDEVKEIYKKIGYELLANEDEYKNSLSKLKFKCNNAHINEMTLNSITQGNKCSICTKNKKLTYDFVKQEFEKRDLTLVSTTYTNARTLMDFICNKNSHKYQISYDDLRHNINPCARCAGMGKLNFEDIKKEFEDEGYTLLSTTYINAHKKLKYKCDNNHIVEISYTHFKSGKRCPKCQESRGERAIRKFLETSSDIESFISEHKFPDCKNINCLPFDFYVNDKFLIEFDGCQHFDAYDFFGGQKTLEETQKRDKIKTDYCRKNNIPLLRISYKHISKITDIIKDFMDKLDEDPSLIHFTDADLYKHLA